MKLWTKPTQQYTSIRTAVNSTRPAAAFRLHPWTPGTLNADLGGGRFDAVTRFLEQLGVRNVTWDPFARAPHENAAAVAAIAGGQADTVTVTNVLNVIAEPRNRHKLILEAADAMRPGGAAIFQIYEGDQSGQGRVTKPDCWQENRRTESYLDEIRKVFPLVLRKGNVIYAY